MRAQSAPATAAEARQWPACGPFGTCQMRPSEKHVAVQTTNYAQRRALLRHTSGPSRHVSTHVSTLHARTRAAALVSVCTAWQHRICRSAALCSGGYLHDLQVAHAPTQTPPAAAASRHGGETALVAAHRTACTLSEVIGPKLDNSFVDAGSALPGMGAQRLGRCAGRTAVGGEPCRRCKVTGAVTAPIAGFCALKWCSEVVWAAPCPSATSGAAN